MNHVQWAFMAEAFRRKEAHEQERLANIITEVFTASQRSLRELLIHLLGLNIGAGKAKTEGSTPYYPFATLVARPEVMEHLLKRNSDNEVEENVLADKGLDELNENLMNLEVGDLEPVFSGQNSNDPYVRWTSEQNLHMLQSMGIDLVDDNDIPKED